MSLLDDGLRGMKTQLLLAKSRDCYAEKSVSFEVIEAGAINIDMYRLIETLSEFHGGLGINVSEMVFYLHYRHRGYSIERLPLRKGFPSWRYIKEKYVGMGINTDALLGKGCPDFLIFKPGFFCFIEVKETEYGLNRNQKDWVLKWGYPLRVVRLSGDFQ